MYNSFSVSRPDFPSPKNLSSSMPHASPVATGYNILRFGLSGIVLTFFMLFSVVSFAEEGKKLKVLQQKLFLLNNMVSRGATVKKIRQSGSEEAMELLKQAEDLHQIARESLDAGKHEEAGHVINDAIRLLSSASAKAQGKKGSTAIERDRYQELLGNISSLQKSAENDFTTNIDLDPVVRIKKEAEALTATDNYAGALKKLNTAYQYIVTQMADNVGSTTVVYSLDFKTSKDEYEYELRRYNDNRKLVSQLLFEHEKNPTRLLIERYTEQADKTQKLAMNHASSKEHDQALQTIEKANKELKRSMGMLGVNF